MKLKRIGILALLVFLTMVLVGCADESSSDNTDLIVDDGNSENSGTSNEDNTGNNENNNSDEERIAEYQMWYVNMLVNHLNYVLGNSDLGDTTTWDESIANVLPKDYPTLNYPVSVSSIYNILATTTDEYNFYVDYYSVIINNLTEEQINNIFNTLQEYYEGYSDDTNIEAGVDRTIGASIEEYEVDGYSISIPIITTDEEGDEISGVELHQKSFSAAHSYTTENGVEPYYLAASSLYNPSNSRGSIMLIYMVNYNYVYH